MNLERLSARSLRSKISKYVQKPEQWDWEEARQMEDELERRMQEETDRKQTEKWLKYAAIIDKLKADMEIRNELQKERREARSQQREQDDSMSELRDNTPTPSTPRSSPASTRTRREADREESWESPNRNGTEEPRSSTRKKENNDRLQRHCEKRRRSSSDGRHHRERRAESRHRRHRSYTPEEERRWRKEKERTMKRQKRSRRIYQSESETEFEHEDRDRRRQSYPLDHVDYSFIDAIDVFDSDFSKWSLFRDVIEESVLKPRSMINAMKVAVVTKLLKGIAHSIWNNKVAGTKDLNAGWDALIDYFEDPRQIDAYLHGLVAKTPRVAHDMDIKALEEMLTHVMNFRALVERMGHDRGAQARELCLIISNKFWNEESKKIKTDYHSVGQLASRVEKLHRKAQILTTHHRDPKPYLSNRPFQTRVSAINLRKKCNFCNSEEHWSSDCVAPMSYEEKRRIISERRLCGRCCRAGHFANQCRSKAPQCNTCRKDHATVLHGVRMAFLPQPNVALVENITQNESNVEGEAEMVVLAVGHAFKQHFWTRTLYNGHVLKTLLDTGAAITIISDNCVPKYARRPVDEVVVHGFAKDMAAVLQEQATVEIEADTGPIMFSAYVSQDMNPNTLIIGRDQMKLFLKKESRVMRTVLGDYDFEMNRWKPLGTNEVACVDDTRWYEREEEEKVDEREVDMILQKIDSGRYVARMPFFSKKRPRANFLQAVKKVEALVKRLGAKNRMAEYQEQIMELVNAGHAVEIQEETGHFIGHREVEKPGAESTKFRVVLTPLELNELLWKGEARGLDVLSHLLRFRLNRYAVTADLQKAFLQVIIHEDDRKYLQFVWLTENTLRKYQMTVLPFGIVSAPAILTKVVEMITEELSNNTKAIIKGAVYMDDIITGSDDVEALKSAMKEAEKLFKVSGFKLHKIRSNLAEWPAKEEQTRESKVLGVGWNTKTDDLSIKLPTILPPRTRREFLSLVGRIFDPYGAYDPCKLGLRLLLVRIGSRPWDEVLPEDIQAEIKERLRKTMQGKEIRNNRWIPQQRQMWCFSDASKIGLGYVMYLGNQLLFGKAKVSNESRSIVDGELQALFELVKAIPKILASLKSMPEIRILSDSQINLGRLKKSPNDHSTVEARRLMIILKTAGKVGASFHHIKGTHNPADCFSRPQDLKDAQKWLWLDEKAIAENMSESLPIKIVCTIQTSARDSQIHQWLEEKPLSAQLRLIWRLKLWYRRAVKSTLAGRASPLANLVFVCQQGNLKAPPECRAIEGVWCYPTRQLQNSPMWVPNGSRLAGRLLRDAHKRSLHRGLDMSMALIPPNVHLQNGNRQMRKIISQCSNCKKQRAPGIRQPLGPLHDNQVRACKPFEDITMDGFGPMKLANGRKYWGIVSVCRTAQAVRLNVLEDLTTETLLAVLMYQWGKTGFPRRIHSDHGSNFTGVRNCIKAHPTVETMDIDWTLSTPTAPWMNGKAEKMVHLTKTCLNEFPKPAASHLGAQRRLGTVEQIINSRPILHQDGVAISAFEIAQNRKLLLTGVDGNASRPDLLLKDMRHQERELGLLWKSQYLKKAAKYCPRKGQRILIDDVFLVPDLRKRRLSWATAKVSRCRVGSDGICRSVELTFPNGDKLDRPVQGLIPLTPLRAAG